MFVFALHQAFIWLVSALILKEIQDLAEGIPGGDSKIQ
jgi:hypothetical protein